MPPTNAISCGPKWKGIQGYGQNSSFHAMKLGEKEQVIRVVEVKC